MIGLRFWVTLGSKLILAAFLFGLAWWFYTGGSKVYEKEFDLTREALKSVKTWKYEVVRGDDPDAYWEGATEVDCGLGFHGTVHWYNGREKIKGEEWGEAIGTKYREYSKYGGWDWQPGNTVMQSPMKVCMQMAQGDARFFFPDNKELEEHYVVTKKEVKEVNGIACRQWLIQRPRTDEITICLGVNDHLPYEMDGPERPHRIFSDYNKPIEFQWPDIIYNR